MQWLKSPGVARALALAKTFGQGETLDNAIADAEPTDAQLQRWREWHAHTTNVNREDQSEPAEEIRSRELRYEID